MGNEAAEIGMGQSMQTCWPCKLFTITLEGMEDY